MEEKKIEEVPYRGLYQGGEFGLNLSPGVSGKPLNVVEKTIEGAKELGFNVIDEIAVKVIDEIALNVFQNRTGLILKKDLTAEQIKSITDIDDFKYYRDIAKTIYDKKQKSVLNKKYPIIDVPASGKPRWWEGAYALVFVYSKYNGNFILRGYVGEVDKFLNENYTHYFCYKSMWCRGESRGFWRFWKKNIGIFEPDTHKSRRNKEYKFIVKKYSESLFGYGSEEDENDNKNELILKFKRLPKRWIPEFDKF